MVNYTWTPNCQHLALSMLCILFGILTKSLEFKTTKLNSAPRSKPALHSWWDIWQITQFYDMNMLMPHNKGTFNFCILVAMLLNNSEIFRAAVAFPTHG